MPIYTFLCKDGHKNDKLVKMGQEKIACPTPDCKKKATQVFDAGVKPGTLFHFNYMES